MQKGSRQHIEKLFQAYKTERSSFIPHYKEISRYIMPRRGRYLTTDRNKGDREYNTIINSAATRAFTIYQNGMLSGVMSPARPWFDLVIDDKSLMEFKSVKIWLDMLREVVLRVFNESNMYQQARLFLGEVGLYGTAVMSHEKDFENVARFYTHTAGSYVIGQDENFRVNTFGREFEMTVEQVVGKFTYGKVSKLVRRLYDQGEYTQWVPIIHFIEPNPKYDLRSPYSNNFLYRQVYLEPGQKVDEEDFLEEKGFKRFPIYAGRWETTAEDIYGTNCPGMASLGDVRMLQDQELEKSRAIAKMVKPPMTGPGSLANKDIDASPNGITIYDDSGNASNQLRAIYSVNPRVQELILDIKETIARIDDAFHTPLFMAITNMEGVQPRNMLELNQRNQERLLQLGPVLDSLHGDFLQKLVSNTIQDIIEASSYPDGRWRERALLPPPPEELRGKEIRPKFISSIAIAQRAAGVGPIEQTLAFAAGMVQAGLVRDGKKIDGDQAIDEFAARVGAPPTIIRDDREVAQERAAEAQQAQLANQVALGQAAAKGAKDGAAAIGQAQLNARQGQQ